MTEYFSRRTELRMQWDRVNDGARQRTRPMDPVLANAIKNARTPKRYGSRESDYTIREIGARGVDTYIKLNRDGDRRVIQAAKS
jgi:hypothetical protein